MSNFRIGIAADHGGYALKIDLIAWMQAEGYELEDFGAYAFEPADDYPDFVVPLARAVAAGKVQKGIAICGSGIGASIAANKVSGARAALVMDHYSAHQGVEHDDMNILCLGARVIGFELARELSRAFLQATYTGEERHNRRLDKVKSLES